MIRPSPKSPLLETHDPKRSIRALRESLHHLIGDVLAKPMKGRTEEQRVARGFPALDALPEAFGHAGREVTRPEGLAAAHP